MDEKQKELVDQIVKSEWNMFQQVHNQGGRASCQNDWMTFEIMRKSQFYAWDSYSRLSYMADLINAEGTGRNLLMEKYARMMQYTAPEEYEKIKDSLPELSKEQLELIDQIAAIHVQWEKEFAVKSPKLVQAGRPITKEEERPGETSAETYLRGELATYSMDTLNCYAHYIVQLKQEGKNICAMILENTVKMYGYESVEQYEILVK